MRTPLIAGNWKLNKTIGEATAYIEELKPLIQDASGLELLICPVFTALSAASQSAQGSAVHIGGQDLYWKESGAYTGEVPASLLKDAGCTHVLIGHSERRGRFGVPEPDLQGAAAGVFGDTDASVALKVRAAVSGGLTPIVCVGETLQERQDGRTDDVVREQVSIALGNLDETTVGNLVFAYEPVWAIGTGETCEAPEANRVCGTIRSVIATVSGEAAAEGVRVLYGGSVKPDNAGELLGHEHIDGALIGGASLKADSFAAIVRAAQS